MKILLIFNVLVAALVLANGRNTPHSRVYGGNVVRNQIPYIASIRLKTLLVLYVHRCGGSIINSQYILTSAQCTYGQSAGDLRVVLGILNLDDSGIANQQTLGVSQIIIHSSYPGGGLGTRSLNDISLIKTSSTIVMGPNVGAIIVPPAALPVGVATVCGWGSTDALGTISSSTLYCAQVNVISSDACETILETQGADSGFDTTDNICTIPLSAGAQAPCGTRDIGGPLVRNNTLLGIVSWKLLPCGDTSKPSVYTSAAAYYTWIATNAV